jgi:hypothetical protein
MTRRNLYKHIISTNWRGIETKIKQFKKKKYDDKKRNE